MPTVVWINRHLARSQEGRRTLPSCLPTTLRRSMGIYWDPVPLVISEVTGNLMERPTPSPAATFMPSRASVMVKKTYLTRQSVTYCILSLWFLGVWEWQNNSLLWDLFK